MSLFEEFGNFYLGLVIVIDLTVANNRKINLLGHLGPNNFAYKMKIVRFAIYRLLIESFILGPSTTIATIL